MQISSDCSILSNIKTKARGAPGRQGGQTITKDVETAAERNKTNPVPSSSLTWSSEKNRILHLTREERRKVL